MDGVLRGSQEALDPEVLLDPLEEEFDLPAHLVEPADVDGGDQHAVGHEAQAFVRLRVAVRHAPDRGGILLWRLDSAQHALLVAAQSERLVDRTGVAPPEERVFLCPCHEERAGGAYPVKPLEIEVTPVDQIISARLERDLVQSVDVVLFRVGDVDERRDVPPHVQGRMHLDPGLGLPETGPREERQAQLDRGRVERVNGVAQVDVQRLARIQPPRLSDKQKRDIPVDAPVPRLVRVGEVVAGNAGLDAHVVQMPAVRRKARLDVAQAFAPRELRESHHVEMAPTRERLDPLVALVPLHYALELPLRKVVHHLTENRSPLMHSRPPSVSKEETVASELKRSQTFSYR